MQSSLRRSAFPVLCALLIAVASCSTGVSNGDGTNANSTNGHAAVAGLSESQKSHLVEDADTTWDVELSEETTLVQGDALDALQSSDGAGTLVFDEASANAANIDLTEGRVLLLAGKTLGRISGVSSSGSEVTVQTEPAALADAIEEGTVGWDVPIEFDFDQFVTDPDATADGDPEVTPSVFGSSDPGSTDDEPRLHSISMAMPDGDVVPVVGGTRTADDPPIDIEVKPEDGSVEWTVNAGSNKYQFRITAQGESADFLVVVSRGGGGKPKMAYRGEGTLKSMRSKSTNEFSGGAATSSNVGMDDLNAELKLSASAAGAGVSPVDLEVPVPMLTYVWPVGPIPVTVSIKADIIGSVKATAKASATAEASFSYSGDAGFSYDGTEISTSGNTDIEKMDPEPADSAAPMGVDVDAQFGVAFPDVSFSIFDQGLVPSIHFGAVVGSNLHWGPPKAGFAASTICKSGYVRAEVVGEYDLKIMDMTLGHGEHEFWKDRKDSKNDSEGCRRKDAESDSGSG